MQGYQIRLIFFALFIIVTYAETKINSFTAIEPDTADNHSTIYANHVKLWANVIDCPSATCECKVRIDGLEDEPRTLKFLNEKEGLASVDISNLATNTDYSFILTCDGSPSSVNETLNITTDYGRPSAPQIITAALVSKRVKVTWSAAAIPSDSFSYYKILIDENLVPTNVSKNDTSYQMPKDYEEGIKHTFIVAACYINNQKETFCSNATGANVSFSIPVTRTPLLITTTIGSTGVYSYSISVSMIIFFLLFSQMK